jgi:branched-subunit amino acid transport protein
MAISYTDPMIWGLIVAIGGLTYLIRISFIALFGYLDEIPTGLERTLRYVPAAVLGALVAPSFITLDASGFAVDTFVAGALATAVAWRTESVFATMAVGMGGLWVVRFLVLPAL